MGDLQRGKDDNVLIHDLLQLNIDISIFYMEYRDIAFRDATWTEHGVHDHSSIWYLDYIHFDATR